MKRLYRSPLFLVSLTVFLDFTGFGLIIPLLPFFAERLGASPFEIGLLLTVYAVAQFLFTPLLGRISDRIGRRPVLIWSLLIEALSLALTALSGSLALLLVARFIGGLGASNVGSAQAVVADVTTAENRARGMGAVGAAIGLGFVVGPALGGVFAQIGPTAPFWVAFAGALLNAVLVFALLPETRRRIKWAKQQRAAGVVLLLDGWRKLLRSPALASLIAVNFLYMLAFTGMETVLPLLTQRFFGWRAEANGYLFAYVGVLVVVMQGGLVGRLARRFGERRLLLAGLLLLALGLTLLPFGASVGALLVAVGLLSIGDGAVSPAVSALLSLTTSAETQGETLGLSQGVAGLGRVIGPLLAGVLFVVAPGAPFFLGAALALAACGIAAAFARLGRRGMAGRVAPAASIAGADAAAVAGDDSGAAHMAGPATAHELSESRR